jgi:predicted membrane protein
MFIAYYLVVLIITVIHLSIKSKEENAKPEHEFCFTNIALASIINCFWPIVIAVKLIDKTPVGYAIPHSNLDDVNRADSLRQVPNTPDQYENRGGNISNSPDYL